MKLHLRFQDLILTFSYQYFYAYHPFSDFNLLKSVSYKCLLNIRNIIVDTILLIYFFSIYLFAFEINIYITFQ